MTLTDAVLVGNSPFDYFLNPYLQYGFRYLLQELILKLFETLYNKVIAWSKHQHAPKYLAAVSFAEASFFPISVAVMLLPMSLEQPSRAWRLASLTLIFSVLGGIIGYLLGWGAYELVQPLVSHHADKLANKKALIRSYQEIVKTMNTRYSGDFR